MAKSVNKAILLGNVGKDPEIRTLPSGVKVATLTVATSDRYKDKSGEWKEQTEWHTAVAYARVAEVVEKYVTKGNKLYIEGKIVTRSWEDTRSGEKKYQTEIKIEDLVLLAAPPVNPVNAPASQSYPSTRIQRETPDNEWDFR